MCCWWINKSNIIGIIWTTSVFDASNLKKRSVVTPFIDQDTSQGKNGAGMGRNSSSLCYPFLHHTFSNRIAMPCPPPMHALPIAVFTSARSLSWCARWALMRAPEAPTGWPKAIAPPWGFARAGSRPSSFCTARNCGAKASLTCGKGEWGGKERKERREELKEISHPRCPSDQGCGLFWWAVCGWREPAQCPSPWDRTQQRTSHRGAPVESDRWRKRPPRKPERELLRRRTLPVGRKHRAQNKTRQADNTKRTALTDAFPAVTVPFFLKTAGSLASLSREASLGCSSVSTTASPFFDFTTTGAISDLNWPLSFAEKQLTFLRQSLCHSLFPKRLTSLPSLLAQQSKLVAFFPGNAVALG